MAACAGARCRTALLLNGAAMQSSVVLPPLTLHEPPGGYGPGYASATAANEPSNAPSLKWGMFVCVCLVRATVNASCQRQFDTTASTRWCQIVVPQGLIPDLPSLPSLVPLILIACSSQRQLERGRIILPFSISRLRSKGSQNSLGNSFSI